MPQLHNRIDQPTNLDSIHRAVQLGHDRRHGLAIVGRLHQRELVTAQRVTVTGVNDAFVDGNKNYTIVTAPATSTDPVYNPRDAADVSMENRDDETINFSPPTINVNESAVTPSSRCY